jgi:hypothetical protein
MNHKLRFAVLCRDNFRCRYCGRPAAEALLEVDHLTPQSAGGGDALDNLVTACGSCNRGKNDAILLGGAPAQASRPASQEEIAAVMAVLKPRRRPSPGRRRHADPLRRVNTMLDDWTIQTAAAHAGGNLSAGLREAVRRALAT